MRSNLPALLAVLLCTAAASRASAAARLTPLGDLPGGSFESRAATVSADGSVVVGQSVSASGPEAFRWTATSGMERLSDVLLANGVNPAADGWTQLGGAGVSADGSTIFGGGIRNGNLEAFRWTSGRPMVRLGDLPGGGISTAALGISADGSVIVGDSDVGLKDSDFTFKSEAFRWTSSGGIVGLGVLPGENFGTTARDVSGDGSVVVGYAHTAESEHEAFRWTATSGMVLLGDLPGGGLVQSAAYAISGDGSVLVGYGSSDTGIEAFRWTSGGGMVVLGAPGGILNSLALAVSDDGSTVVGQGNTFAGYEALFWTSAAGTERLWDVLLANGVNPAADGWTQLTFATGISADGNTIVGYGIRNGNTEAFVAVVSIIPEPSSLALLTLTTVPALLRRRQRSRRRLAAHFM